MAGMANWNQILKAVGAAKAEDVLKVAGVALNPFSALVPGMVPTIQISGDDDDEDTAPRKQAIAAEIGRPVSDPVVAAVARDPLVKQAFKLKFPAGMTRTVQAFGVDVARKVLERGTDFSRVGEGQALQIARNIVEEERVDKPIGGSGNLYGELQRYGIDILFRGTFTAAAGLWGTDVPAGNNIRILKPGVCVLWNLTALAGDYDSSWLLEVLYNTDPWSIPRGSQTNLGNFSWNALNRFVPKPCEVTPGANMFVSGGASAAAGTYIFEGVGVPKAMLDGQDPAFFQYLRRQNADFNSLRAGMLAR